MNQNVSILNKFRNRGVITAAGLILAGVIASLVWKVPAVHAQLAAWKLVPQPAAYTELSFDNSLGLPFKPQTGPIHFEFQIHNLERTTVRYPYELIIDGPDGIAQVVGGGTVTLTDGASANVPTYVVLPKADLSGRTQVTVWLPNQQQEIDFWLGVTQ